MPTPKALTLALLLLGPQDIARAQSLSIILTEGDMVGGVGRVTRVDGLAVRDSGLATIEVDTDNADPDADGVLLLDGQVFFREGEPLASPPGALVGSFDGVSIGPGFNVGTNLFLDGAVTSNTNSGIYIGSQSAIPEGSVCAAPEVTAGTTYRGFFDIESAGSTLTWLIVASLDDPAIPSTVDRALVVAEIDGSGTVLSERIVAKEGDVLPGQTGAITEMETGAEESAINASGQVIYSIDVDGPTSADRSVYLDQTLLMREGSPSPVAGRNWGSLTSVEVDLADSGNWVAKANLDSSNTADDDVIVKDGAIFRRAGDTLPAIAPFTLTDFGGSVGVWITATGDVIWFGQWNDPDTSRDEGLFINDQLVVQEGVTAIGGQTITDLSDITEQVAVSADGLVILMEGTISQGTDLDVVIEIDRRLGVNYCMANPNSTGSPGIMGLAGSAVVSANDLTLQAFGLPPMQFGMFLTSRAQGFEMNVGGSEGNLCLGAAIGRYTLPSEIVAVDASGRTQLPVDLTFHPTPGGRVAVVPGDTWSFQLWHRDSVGPVATSNFTDGITLVFQ